MSVSSTSDSDDDPFQQLQTKSRVKDGKPGQRYVTPSELDPLRLFYESLYHENNESAMACRWCLDHGVLDGDEAVRAIKHLRKLAQSASRTSIPTIDYNSSDAFMSDEPEPLPRRTPIKSSKENKQSNSQSKSPSNKKSNKKSIKQSNKQSISKATVTNKGMSDSDAFDSDEDRRINEYQCKLEKSKKENREKRLSLKSKIKTPAKSKSSKSLSTKSDKSGKSAKSEKSVKSVKSAQSSKSKKKDETPKKPPKKLFRDMLSSDDD